METAFDQQRAGAVVAGLAEATIVAHAHAGGMAGVGDDGGGVAQRQRQVDVALFHAGQLQRHVGIAHRVEVQQPVAAFHPGTDLGRAAAFLVVRRGQLVLAPDAVHVFVHEARGGVVGRVEAVEGGQVAEGQRQAAPTRTQAGGQRVLSAQAPHSSLPWISALNITRLPGTPESKCHTRGVRIAGALGRQVRTGEQEGTRTGRGGGCGHEDSDEAGDCIGKKAACAAVSRPWPPGVLP